MKISICSNIVVIQDFIELEGHQLGNIEYMGFFRNGDGDYVSSGKDNHSLIVEITDYLDNENIIYELCPKCLNIVDEHKEHDKDFRILKERALNFKNGSFDVEEYHMFIQSLSGILLRPLKAHQVKAAYHLYIIKNGANFSVPGSGKTSVVLSVYAKLKDEGKVNTLFVVGPLASFGPWRSEFEMVLGKVPDSKVLAGGSREKRQLNYFDTTENSSELYLTSFQTLLFDLDNVKHLFDQNGIDVFLVIDEAHYIKRIEGQWANAVLSLSSLTKYRCVLTGTPMPKSFMDSFNLFDFLWPYKSPIDEDAKIRIQNLENNGLYEEAGAIIKDKINPLFYRVRKSELGLEEQVFFPPIMVDMNPYERKIYKAIKNRIEDYSRTDYIDNIEFVSKLYRGRMIRLRQAASNTALISSSIEDYEEDILEDRSELKQIVFQYENIEIPAKILKLIDLVKGFQRDRKKVVIWSNFIGTLRLIEKHLLSNSMRCKIIYGGTPIEKESETIVNSREQIRNEFVDENSGLDILIANPAACAESISLHKTCQDAIYYDLSYNCAQYLQSLDRIHRVGGSELKKSNYYFLQYRSTIDIDIFDNLNRKAEKMYSIIEEEFGIYSLDMTTGDEDLEAYNRLF
ncbi:SNF2-related protein [Poritiphilus flavus]|uniref:DEAD/DEAH box helicase family protein n=1 Tax=Poritiphilus flavus TaxID=2697053 RepID=A0A6L9EFZ9_9FLAO|nr:DEAD/DEAH box helicase [Poritiphilus flavus]NAS13700.1 DEAD/DEAH box helicase family protein [Poritiphilus flavus]